VVLEEIKKFGGQKTTVKKLLKDRDASQKSITGDACCF
jgi:hypothetical protein